MVMKNIMKLLLFLCPFSVLSQIKEPWVSRPQNDWPQIAMTNNIQYKTATGTFTRPSPMLAPGS